MSVPNKKTGTVLVVRKKVGETPLAAIERVREENPQYKDETITYAGRLDPMAEGVLVLLVGSEVGRKEEYLKLDKEYVFEILFGFSTDTFDALGLVTDTSGTEADIKERALEDALKGFIGKQEQVYPPFSSKTVDGKPLFEWARESRLHEIRIPIHAIEISELSLTGLRYVSKAELEEEIQKDIKKVQGDFRQDEVRELWREYIKIHPADTFCIAACRAACSGGTYIRRLVDDIGKKLAFPATTLHIKRERVGNYQLKDNI